jgi:hypothetical protein
MFRKKEPEKKPKIDISKLPPMKNALGIVVAKRPETGELLVVLISEDGAIAGNVDEILGSINVALADAQKKGKTIFNDGVV